MLPCWLLPLYVCYPLLAIYDDMNVMWRLRLLRLLECDFFYVISRSITENPNASSITYIKLSRGGT